MCVKLVIFLYSITSATCWILYFINRINICFASTVLKWMSETLNCIKHLLIWGCVCSRGWTTLDFFKSTFMWLKSSQLVADDVINEQSLNLELRLEHRLACAKLWHMTALPTRLLLQNNSLFLSVCLSLSGYISHRFLLVLNWIQIK